VLPGPIAGFARDVGSYLRGRTGSRAQNFYVEATDGTHYSAPASYSWTIVAPV